MLSIEFFVTSLVVVLVPGTGVIYTVSTGLFMGRRSSIAAAFGCTLGIIPHLTACILGLSAVLHRSAVAFQTVKYIGAAYLLYLAWSMWRETGALNFSPKDVNCGPGQIMLRGILLNLLNPKLSIFFLAFLPLFISPGAASPTLQMLLLSSVFMAMTLGVFIIYGISAGSVRRYMLYSPRLIQQLQRSFAVVFALLGLKLAVSEK